MAASWRVRQLCLSSTRFIKPLRLVGASPPKPANARFIFAFTSGGGDRICFWYGWSVL